MMQKILLIIAIALFSHDAKSQTLNDPININYSILPKTSFDRVDGNVTTNFIDVNVTTPDIKVNNKVKVFNAFYYRNSNFDYNSSLPQNNSFPTTLHDIRYSAIIRMQLNTKWEIVTIPRIMIRSDLSQSFNGNDFFQQVAVFATYVINGNPNFKIGLGGALNNDFERNAFVPLGSLYYDSKKVKIEIVYPNANFLYKESENFEFGLFASVDGAISRVGPFQLGDDNINYIRTFQLLVAPTASHRIYKQIFGHLKLGFAPIRNFEAMNSDFKATQNQDFDLKSSLFFRTGISFRLKN
ncbi:DUF6268 family outer membrane beta-barrel protein [Flavobacterium sedimenticola]|uniref:DUF6268 family outer membrane beta-barrel protein n=1 Tax=Flavobacterium sedimenticola TaxID=3043286 RepID=A0ABT6XS49_9FLAO|nr:DUF6268 family outer membrane beta-barrel protein [Flavobacterium sedimenticola]MDI9257923.1 DUF6268 family outer membrane beta-barrel protein [Flavobacterium sedimenticola]